MVMVDSAHFMPVSGKSAMCLQHRTDTPTLDIGKKVLLCINLLEIDNTLYCVYILNWDEVTVLRMLSPHELARGLRAPPPPLNNA